MGLDTTKSTWETEAQEQEEEEMIQHREEDEAELSCGQPGGWKEMGPW